MQIDAQVDRPIECQIDRLGRKQVGRHVDRQVGIEDKQADIGRSVDGQTDSVHDDNQPAAATWTEGSQTKNSKPQKSSKP